MSARHTRSAHKSRAGYSLIEVMTAVAVMIVGSTGIAVMLSSTEGLQADAWEQSTALQVATTWMDRVRRDGLLWTAAGAPAQTAYLKDNSCDWFAPVSTMVGEYPAADAFGRDTNVAANMRYCVNLRMFPVQTINGNTNAIRADLLVFWFRSGTGNNTIVNRTGGILSNSSGCPDLGTANVQALAQDSTIHRLYLSNVLTWVAAP
jgi:Tfp pilus assembly protein PilV